MAEDEEVELASGTDDEYEMVPVGPIRKLERRLDEIEQQGQVSRNDDLVRDMLDMMQTNQDMVNSMVESTNELKNSVQDLVNKMDSVVDNMNEFMDLLEEASEASVEEEVSRDLGEELVNPITEKMDDLNETNRKMLEGLSSLGEGIEQLDKRMKRLYASQREEMFESPSQSRRGRRGISREGGEEGSRSGSRERREQ